LPKEEKLKMQVYVFNKSKKASFLQYLSLYFFSSELLATKLTEHITQCLHCYSNVR